MSGGRRGTMTGMGRGAIVGRDAEVARVRAALDAARAGTTTVLLVVGDAGMGKSSLLAEALAGHGPDGTDVVLSASGDEAEVDLDYGIIEQLRRWFPPDAGVDPIEPDPDHDYRRMGAALPPGAQKHPDADTRKHGAAEILKQRRASGSAECHSNQRQGKHGGEPGPPVRGALAGGSPPGRRLELDPGDPGAPDGRRDQAEQQHLHADEAHKAAGRLEVAAADGHHALVLVP